MPRAFQNIFSTISGDSRKQYLVRASYLEIYNEELIDLLDHDKLIPVKKDINITHHFALHSSLDSLDEIVHQNNNMFLKRIDQSGEFNIYGYVTATNIKLLLLIDDKKEDAI